MSIGIDRRRGAPALRPLAHVPERAIAGQDEPRLRGRVRLADGRLLDGELPASTHRMIQLWMLHVASSGFVELAPGTRPPGGKVSVDRRARHFLPARRSASDGQWLRGLLWHAGRIVDGVYARELFAGGPREEAFVGVTARTRRAGGREHVTESRWLWVDIDEPARLDGLYAFLAERPCQLLVSTGGGPGHVHAYWRLDRPLPATRTDAGAGELSEPIERANGRLVRRLGGDRVCRDRSRLVRLAGSPNYKRGEWARIVHADLALPAYTLGELVGDLPDIEHEQPPRPAARGSRARDRYRRIPAAQYMIRLAGRRPNRAGFVRCPAPDHRDEHPSCHVGGPNPECWQCMSCGAAGGIYDLASIVLGGPYGRGQLHGEDFKRARELVAQTFAAAVIEREGQATERSARSHTDQPRSKGDHDDHSHN
ncbi:MAG: hypothetical protein ABSG43_29770 [Solirubrobacteraceae bacterium]